MSKIINYYPAEYYFDLDSGLRREDMVAALDALKEPCFPEEIWEIVSAYLLNPLREGELESIRGPRAIEALDREVAHIDTMTSKMAHEYIEKYKTYGVLAEFTLADLGRRVYGAYRLHVTDLNRLNEYQAAFPTIRHLVLKGDKIPEGQRISAKKLDHLDLFSLLSHRIPSLDSIPAISRLSFHLMGGHYTTSVIVKCVALKHIAKLRLNPNMKLEINAIISSTHGYCYSRLTVPEREQVYYEEWELNKRLNYRDHFDFNQITHLSDSVFSPGSKIRDLFINTYLPQISIDVRMIISDYLTESDTLVDYEDLIRYQGIEDAKEVFKRRIRQNESQDPLWRSEPRLFRYRYEQVFGSKKGFEEFYSKTAGFGSSKDPIAES